MKKITKLIIALILVPLLAVINIPLANASGWVNTVNPNVNTIKPNIKPNPEVESMEGSAYYVYEDNFIIEPIGEKLEKMRKDNPDNPDDPNNPEDPKDPEDPKGPDEPGMISQQETTGGNMNQETGDVDIAAEEYSDDSDDDYVDAAAGSIITGTENDDASTGGAGGEEDSEESEEYSETYSTEMHLEIGEKRNEPISLLNSSFVEKKIELGIGSVIKEKIYSDFLTLGGEKPDETLETKLSIGLPDKNLEIVQPNLNTGNKTKNSTSKESVIEKALSQLENKNLMSSKDIQPIEITEKTEIQIAERPQIERIQVQPERQVAERPQAAERITTERVVERITERPQIERMERQEPQAIERVQAQPERQVIERPQIERQAIERSIERTERQEPRAPIERAERPQIERVQPERQIIERPQIIERIERPQIERLQTEIAQSGSGQTERPSLEETRRRALLRN